MFDKLIAVFKNKNVRDRIIFTLGILLIFKIGSSITIPRVSLQKALETSGSSYLNLLNILGGGGLTQFSVFALGVSPYITASIIISLLSMETVLPALAELQKKGEVGRKKIESANRYLAMLLGAVQSYTILLSAEANGLITKGSLDRLDYIYVTIVLVGGTFFVMWLADQITSKGVGNGVSMIIFAGIVAGIPEQFIGAFQTFVNFSLTSSSIFNGLLKYIIYVIAYIAVIVFVVYMESAQRKIPVQYSNTSGQQGKEVTFLPIKINSAGVIPVIFASTLLMAPQTIATFIQGTSTTTNSFVLALNQITTIGTMYKGFHWGITLYLILTFAFTFIYSNMQVSPDKISENFQKSGSYIPGIRPGNETTRYVAKVLNRVTFLGAVFITVVAALPLFIPMWFKLSSNLAMGGTGIIIVIGVAIETSTQINGYLTGKDYRGFAEF